MCVGSTERLPALVATLKLGSPKKGPLRVLTSQKKSASPQAGFAQARKWHSSRKTVINRAGRSAPLAHLIFGSTGPRKHVSAFPQRRYALELGLCARAMAGMPFSVYFDRKWSKNGNLSGEERASALARGSSLPRITQRGLPAALVCR